MNDATPPSSAPIVTELQVAPAETSLAPTIQDCWNTIGVGGNHSCRELTRHIHCHNCPIYSAAAAQFLDRPLTPDYRREWTDHFAREKKIATPAKTSAIIFRISGEWLGMPTQAFQEIAERRSLHSLPHRRRGIVLGIVNIRGELLICASIGKLLGLVLDAANDPEAITYYRKALYLDPNHYETLVHAALWLERTGDLVGARAFKRRVERVHPQLRTQS